MKKKLGAIALLTAVVMAMTGCGIKFDAAQYVKGIMDNLYLDDSTAYMKNVEITAEEAHAEYQGGLEAEADYFIQYFGIEEDGVSDEVYQQIVDMYSQIYKNSKYEVKEAVKNGDDYNVEVVIKPMDIIKISYDDIEAKLTEFFETADPEAYADGVALDDEIARIIMEVINGNISKIGYLEDKSVLVKVEKDADGYYGISDDAMTNLDTEVIAYYFE